MQNDFERKVRTMEKINREELMKRLNLTEEELEKITGGVNLECFSKCIMKGSEGSNSEVPLVIKCMREC